MLYQHSKSCSFVFAVVLWAIAFVSSVTGNTGHSHIHIHTHDRPALAAAFQVYLPAWWVPEESKWAGQSQFGTSISNPEYHAQDLEDLHAIENYFYGKNDLFYLEMGALDGIRFSNTLYLQQAMSWRGMLIEPNPTEFKSMVANRPDDVGVNAAICDISQNVHFINAGPVGGILEFMSEGFKEQWKPDADKAELISCLPLESILSKLKVSHIDFWSLDVEGAELKVIKTFDWRSVTVDVMVVEADGHDPIKDQAVIDFLVSEGYIHDGLIKRNNWFHHQSFSPSIKA